MLALTLTVRTARHTTAPPSPAAASGMISWSGPGRLPVKANAAAQQATSSAPTAQLPSRSAAASVRAGRHPAPPAHERARHRGPAGQHETPRRRLTGDNRPVTSLRQQMSGPPCPASSSRTASTGVDGLSCGWLITPGTTTSRRTGSDTMLTSSRSHVRPFGT